MVLALSAASPFAAAQAGPPAQEQTADKAAPSTPQQKPLESLWKRTEDDPVALYTLFLTVFTAALVGVSGVQIRFLTQADKTARVTASAAEYQARVAEKAFLASTRPWLVVEVQEGYTAREVFRYDLVNYGNSPAIVLEHFDAVIAPNHRIADSDIDKNPMSFTTNLIIAPNGGRKDYLSVGDFDRPEVAQGTMHYAIGKVLYEGVNGLQCETRFCWEYNSLENYYYQTANPPNLNRRT